LAYPYANSLHRSPLTLGQLSLTFEGPSKNAQTFLANCNHLTNLGRLKRFCPDGRVHDCDDRYFAAFCVMYFNKTPKRIWNEYQLAKPNNTAGYLSLLKYDKPQPDLLDAEIWAKTMDWAERHFILMSNSDVTDPDVTECDDETDEMWQEIVADVEKRASPGYPWTHWFKTKKELFEFQEGILIKSHCLKYWNDLGDASCRPVFWTNNVKEELRPFEKIILNKLRTFVGSPTEHVVACQQLFGNMNEAMYGTVHRHWSYVGGTKFRRGWNKLYKRLSIHPNAFELDESEYDSSLFRECMYGCAEFRKRQLKPQFRTPQNNNRIDNLYREIVESLIVTQDGDVVMKDTGGPSGSFNTIGDNTIGLFRLLAYAWIRLCRENNLPQYETYEMFVSHVEAALNGDDNTWTCSNEVVGWFNAKSVARIWSGIGVTTKSPCWESRKLEDCWFLSSGFRKIADCWVPYPEYEKVMCSLAFHNPSPMNPRWSLLRACALRIESFWCDRSRQLISDYIGWLLREKWGELHLAQDPKDPKDVFSFNDVYSVYKTDTQIKQLYLMEESGSDDPSVFTTAIGSIEDIVSWVEFQDLDTP